LAPKNLGKHQFTHPQKIGTALRGMMPLVDFGAP